LHASQEVQHAIESQGAIEPKGIEAKTSLAQK
jgi:hypothetical protein